MSDSDDELDISQKQYEYLCSQFEQHAAHLNAIDEPAEDEDIFYEIWSGSLMWRDETNKSTPRLAKQALKSICAYRTSLILGKPRKELEPMWNRAFSLFPGWVGFRVERREPTKKLIKIYRLGHIRTIRCLREDEKSLGR